MLADTQRPFDWIVGVCLSVLCCLGPCLTEQPEINNCIMSRFLLRLRMSSRAVFYGRILFWKDGMLVNQLARESLPRMGRCIPSRHMTRKWQW